MKLALMPRQLGWWTWLATVGLLAAGVTGLASGYATAIALSFAQFFFFWQKTRDLRAISVQIRLAYARCSWRCVTFRKLRWLYWLPIIGTCALLVFGYCLTARTLSVMPWNRTERLSFDLLRRTFFSAPAIARGIVVRSCGSEGVCELEARVATTTA
jgi:hypothetical protein